MTNDLEAVLPGIGEISRPFGDAEFIALVDFCRDALDQNDGVGELLIFFRKDGRLHMEPIDRVDVADLDRCEMILFDGGNTCGDLWKHVFFPRQRRNCFACEAD